MRKLSLNVGFNIFRTLISLLFPIITFPYITRVLGVENVGVVQYYTSIVSYFILFASLGIPFYAVKAGAKLRNNKNELSKFVSEILLIVLFTTAIAYLFLFLIFIFNHEKLDNKLFLIISISLFFSVLSLDWFFNLIEEFIYISIRTFFIRVLSIIALFVFVKNEEDFYIYALINVLVTVVTFVTNWFYIKPLINIKTIEYKSVIKHIPSISIIFFSTIATTIYMNSDIVMLGSLVSSYAVGIYIVAVKFNQAIKMLISSISTVMVSRLSYYAGNDFDKKYNILFNYTFNLISMIVIPSAIGLIVLAEEFILLFSGKDYVEAIFASQILSINIVFSIIDTILYYQILLPFHKEKQAALATIVGATLNIVLNIFVIPLYSYNGAAITTLISEVSVFILLVYYAQKHVNIISYLHSSMFYLIGSLPIFIIAFITKSVIDNTFFVILSTVVLSLLYYVPLVLTFKNEYWIILKRYIKKTISP